MKAERKHEGKLTNLQEPALAILMESDLTEEDIRWMQEVDYSRKRFDFEWE